MASQFTQLIGEDRRYKQVIVGADTIVSANWEVLPELSNGLTLGTVVTDATSSRVFVTALTEGSYVLNVTLVLASGQRVIGQARITVIRFRV